MADGRTLPSEKLARAFRTGYQAALLDIEAANNGLRPESVAVKRRAMEHAQKRHGYRGGRA